MSTEITNRRGTGVASVYRVPAERNARSESVSVHLPLGLSDNRMHCRAGSQQIDRATDQIVQHRGGDRNRSAFQSAPEAFRRLSIGFSGTPTVIEQASLR
jgi:hypothetical protein